MRRPVLIADHISIPADLRRMEMTDKERYERIRETLGEQLASSNLPGSRRAKPSSGSMKPPTGSPPKIDPDASRELVDSLGGDMMMISNELEKLLLYAGDKQRITLADVETMVLAAKQRTLYELTDALSRTTAPRSLEILDAMLSTGDGDEAAIGHLYMLARTFRQMLVILERNVRDTRTLYQVLWRVPHPALRRRRISGSLAATSRAVNSPAPSGSSPGPTPPCAPTRSASASCSKTLSSTSPPNRKTRPRLAAGSPPRLKIPPTRSGVMASQISSSGYRAPWRYFV